LARQIRSWADTPLDVTGSAADFGMSLAQARVKNPKRNAAVAKAGGQLRRWREAAVLMVGELSDAVGLGDAKLIEDAESGIALLPFDVVLRLAGVLGRHDPVPIAMALTCQYCGRRWTPSASAVWRFRAAASVSWPTSTAATMPPASLTTQFAQALQFTRQAVDTAVRFCADAKAPGSVRGVPPPTTGSDGGSQAWHRPYARRLHASELLRLLPPGQVPSQRTSPLL
jgi:hypothetical protein